MKFYQKHSRLVAVLTFAFFVLVGACNFPIYNLTREWPPSPAVKEKTPFRQAEGKAKSVANEPNSLVRTDFRPTS